MTIKVSAPVRVCDNGGWTDTWFGGPGRVLNVAVTPRVEVTIRAAAGDVAPSGNPLVAAALQEYPPGGQLEVSVRSDVPVGSGLGASAAVAVALVAALTAARGEQLTPMQTARGAHHLEADVVGIECGVQDHAAAAFGGINFISVDAYPSFTVEHVDVWPDLQRVLTVVFLGQPHDSSSVHREVIDGGDPSVFERLRQAAVLARDAVIARDLKAFGEALAENTGAQADLHPGVVGRDALVVIEAARRLGSLGWKVNGAGGEGGSITVLSGSRQDKTAFEDWVRRYRRYRVIPVALSADGVRIEGSL
jgi:D-glycero-alpha-D-manno-heptose-7-phosphate kinase